jgi:DNA polymerase-1
MDGSLYVVDALNFLYRAFHALPPLATSKGVPTGAIHGLCQMLLRIEREQRPSHMCVVYDAPGRTFRDDLYPAYKAHRPPMPPELSTQLELTHDVVAAFGLPALSVAGVEADDVIATLARQASAAGIEVVICSSDKDLMQLCSQRIRLLDTMKNRMLGPAEVVEKFGVPPERVGDVLALMGDSIDNVPGVEGIGPKTAAELVKRFGSLDGVLEHAGEIKGKKGQAIAAARAEIEISRQLVRLRDDVDLGRPLDDLRRADPDLERLRALFRELELTRLLAQLDAGTPPAARAPAAPASSPSPPLGAQLGLALAAPAAPEVALVPDAAALERLRAALTAAGSCGIAVFTQGDSRAGAALVGLGFAVPGGRRYYLPLKSQLLGSTPALGEAEALAALAPLLAAADLGKHLHDAKALDVLLRARSRSLAGVASDSMLGAYLLDASRSEYALATLAGSEGIADVLPRSAWLGSGRGARRADDVPAEEAALHIAAEAAAALTLGAAQAPRLAAAGLERLYREVELPLARVLARIECWGIRLDCDFLRRLGGEVAAASAALEREIHALAGGPFNIGSSRQLAEILFGRLGLPVIRKTKTGASTDADVLDELVALHPVPAKIVEYRMLSKLKGTYIDALPALVDRRTGRLHTTFNQAVAATGRLSSSDPNLQNIPIRTDLGRRIRDAFVADPGFSIVSADYSQIELRVLAHFSGDPAFVEAFRSGQDIHRRTAAEVFAVPPEAVSAEQRRIAKAINFGLVFGQTDFGLAQSLRIPRSEARSYIDSYFARYARVREYMDGAIAEARRTGAVATLLGRTRRLPEINSSRVQDRNYAERIARNTPIQGTAADLLKLAMIAVDAGLDRFPDARLLLTVHDELVFEVRTEAVQPFCAWVKEEMESVHPLRVPLVVDVHAGPNWGQAH